MLSSLEGAEYEGNAVRDLYAPLMLNFLNLGLDNLIPAWQEQVKAKFGDNIGEVLVENMSRR